MRMRNKSLLATVCVALLGNVAVRLISIRGIGITFVRESVETIIKMAV